MDWSSKKKENKEIRRVLETIIGCNTMLESSKLFLLAANIPYSVTYIYKSVISAETNNMKNRIHFTCFYRSQFCVMAISTNNRSIDVYSCKL